MILDPDEPTAWDRDSRDGDSYRVVMDTRCVVVTVRFIDGARGGGMCAHEDFESTFGAALDAVFDPDERAEMAEALRLYAAWGQRRDDVIP